MTGVLSSRSARSSGRRRTASTPTCPIDTLLDALDARASSTRRPSLPAGRAKGPCRPTERMARRRRLCRYACMGAAAEADEKEAGTPARCRNPGTPTGRRPARLLAPVQRGTGGRRCDRGRRCGDAGRAGRRCSCGGVHARDGQGDATARRARTQVGYSLSSRLRAARIPLVSTPRPAAFKTIKFSRAR